MYYDFCIYPIGDTDVYEDVEDETMNIFDTLESTEDASENMDDSALTSGATGSSSEKSKIKTINLSSSKKKNASIKTGGKIVLNVKANKTVKWIIKGSIRKSVTLKKQGKYSRKLTLTAGSKTGKITVLAKVGKKSYRCVIKVKK